MLRYSVVLVPEEGVYVAHVPVLGCVTQGNSVEDALDAARDMIPHVVATLQDKGEYVAVEEGPALLCVLEVQEIAPPVPADQATEAAPRA
jgi:predicted RNase H-like HicB family nuclease